MANKYLKRGLVPIWDMAGPVTKKVPKSTSSSKALLVGSPVLFTGGYAQSAAVGGDSDKITGSVVALTDSAGKPVNQLVHDAAGYVEISFKQDQQYRITSNDDGIAIGDIGYSGQLNNDDAADPTDPNQTFSLAQIDGSTLNDAAGPLQVVGIVDRLDNDFGATGTEVVVKIDPDNYQAS